MKVDGNKTINECIVEIAVRTEAVAAERDNLDDLIGELDHLRDNCRSAYENLQHARDALSELV